MVPGEVVDVDDDGYDDDNVDGDDDRNGDT